MDTDMKLYSLLCRYEELYGIRPNKIIMGYKLIDELRAKFFSDFIMTSNAEGVKYIKTIKARHEYEGISIVIDYDNPNTLEAGYVFEWLEPKKG